NSNASMQEILDVLFPQETPLKRMIALNLSGYEGSPPQKLCVHHNLDTLQYILEGVLQEAQNVNSPRAYAIFKGIKGGNAQLPEKLAEHLAPNIHQNKVLKSVQRGQDHPIRLTFTDGTKAVCDKLILALPCSVYTDIDFDSSLIPPERLNQIQQVQYGSAAKIIIPANCPDRYWNFILGDAMSSFFNEDEKLLLMYFFEESGAHLQANQTQLFEQGLKTLKRGYSQGSFNEAPAVIASDESFAYYDQAVTRGWVEDPYAKGSYSNFGTALKETFSKLTCYKGIWLKKLFEPIEDTLFFAGEHATITDTPGTMEAAVESGNHIVELF
ncbi:MAG TPA: FAD-dependent oxidoreductase, partial [Opitutales bacterium]|nr:FAD-dependent oxidoreductase [Opitutales bacterium]